MKCPKCGMYIREDSRFCNYCGTDLATGLPAEEAESKPLAPSVQEIDEEPVVPEEWKQGDPASMYDQPKGAPAAPVRPRDEDFTVARDNGGSYVHAPSKETPSARPRILVLVLLFLAAVVLAAVSIIVYTVMKRNQRTVVPAPPDTTEAPSGSDITTESESEPESETDTEPEPSSESEPEDGGITVVPETIPGVVESSIEPPAEFPLEQDGIRYLIRQGEAWVARCDSYSPTITLPDKVGQYPVRRILQGAFDKCDHLTMIKIPEGVTHIEAEAFRDCRNLWEAVLPSSLAMALPNSFSGYAGSFFIVAPAGSAAEQYAHSIGSQYYPGTDFYYPEP